MIFQKCTTEKLHPGGQKMVFPALNKTDKNQPEISHGGFALLTDRMVYKTIKA